jgi:hypothetical protein
MSVKYRCLSSSTLALAVPDDDAGGRDGNTTSGAGIGSDVPLACSDHRFVTPPGGAPISMESEAESGTLSVARAMLLPPVTALPVTALPVTALPVTALPMTAMPVTVLFGVPADAEIAAEDAADEGDDLMR